MNDLTPSMEYPYEGSGTLAEKLDRARMELLDLSARNRLLNMPKSSKSAKTVELVDERRTEIFRLLVNEDKTFIFLPGLPSRKPAGERAAATEEEAEEDSDVIRDLALPEDEDLDERGIAARHTDKRLQTRFMPEGLQKRLLDLYFDARTLEDEQGVNVLYLTRGALRWVDPNDKKNIRHAPLLLVPATLERGTAGERFRLRARPEDFATNLSLENFLDRLHGIRLPEAAISETMDIQAYFDSVASSLDGKEGLGVEPDQIVLGFFSFAKFMMYRDLDATTWPETSALTSKTLLRGLLADGFEAGESLHPENETIDGIIQPAKLHHILDSDSSQTLAVHEVRNGRNLVIQGPPGTGKSQTIKVLFKLPLRQTTGMVASLLKMTDLDWAVPDYSTLCRHQKTLAVQIPYRRTEGLLNLLGDSTGIKFLDDGEWQARKRGVQGRRQWRKIHLAMDTARSDIRAVEFTSSSDGDSPVLPDLPDQIPKGEDIGTVTADRAYDTRRCHTAISDPEAVAIIPSRKYGRPWREDCPAAIARN